MVPLLQAQGDLGIVVRGSVGLFLASERKNDASVVVTRDRRMVGLFAAGDFDARPLTPQVDARGGFDHFADVGAAYARGTFQKVKLSIAARADELGVGNAAHQSQGLDQIAVELA